MSTWWYISDGERKGPVSDDDLRRVLTSGKIASTALVWKDGMQSWQPAAQVEALRATLVSLPPEVPPDQNAPQQTTEEAAARWVRGLPIRWGLGGLVIGLIWSFSSAALQGSFSNPVGGQAAGLFRVIALVIVPLGVLGFAWGWGERFFLERVSAQGSDQLEWAVRQSPMRQTGEAMICGALFGFFVAYAADLFNLTQLAVNTTRLFGFALLAAPVGFFVGILSRRNLMRRLSKPR
jgi:hypothetical protein